MEAQHHHVLCIWEPDRELVVPVRLLGATASNRDPGGQPLVMDSLDGEAIALLAPGRHALASYQAVPQNSGTEDSKLASPPSLLQLCTQRPPLQPHLAIPCVFTVDTQFNLVVQSIAFALSFFFVVNVPFFFSFSPTQTAMPEVLPLLVEKL